MPERHARVAEATRDRARREELVDHRVGSGSPGPKPPKKRRSSRHPRGRVVVPSTLDHDVDPDRLLLLLDELASRGRSVVVDVSRCTVGLEKPDSATSFFACLGSYGVQGTLIASYQAVFAGAIGVQLTWSSPPKTTLFIVLRSIASSNACRSFALEARRADVRVRQVADAVRLPMLMKMPRQPSWSASCTRRPEVFRTPARSVVDTWSRTWMSPAFSAAAAAAGRDRLVDDLVEVDVAPVVVVGRLDHRDAVADDAVVEHERADADGIGAEVVPSLSNPARSLDPALFNWSFDDLWIYLVGPLVGALGRRIAWLVFPPGTSGRGDVDPLDRRRAANRTRGAIAEELDRPGHYSVSTVAIIGTTRRSSVTRRTSAPLGRAGLDQPAPLGAVEQRGDRGYDLVEGVRQDRVPGGGKRQHLEPVAELRPQQGQPGLGHERGLPRPEQQHAARERPEVQEAGCRARSRGAPRSPPADIRRR